MGKKEIDWGDLIFICFLFACLETLAIFIFLIMAGVV